MSAIVLTCGVAYAASTSKTLQAEFNNIKVYIDDVLVDLKDANGNKVEPFICDGTTYLPVRGVAQALGCQVEWDGATQSVKLYKDALPDTTYLTDVCPPYSVDDCVTFLQSDGKSFSMAGEKYSDGLAFDGKGWALFNLNGKYSTLECTVGHADLDDREKTVDFIVDGKIVKTVELEKNCLPKKSFNTT